MSPLLLYPQSPTLHLVHAVRDPCSQKPLFHPPPPPPPLLPRWQRKFCEEMERDFPMKNPKSEFGQTITYVLGCKQSDGRKMFFLFPNKLDAAGFLEFLNIYKEKMHFLDIMLLCLNRTLLSFFSKKNEWTALEGLACSPDLNLFETFWAIVKQRLGKQTVFWENFEEKVYEIWNEIDADAVRNMYENYTNRLLDVKKLKVLLRVIREQI